MVLSDTMLKYYIEEKNELGIDPYKPENVQPASIDLTLGGEFAEINYDEWRDSDYIDPLWFKLHPDKLTLKKLSLRPSPSLVILPGQFVLATTAERVSIPDFLVARVEGKSSLARLGLAVHLTAGYIDPGFTGQITLELFNASPKGILVHKGMKFCQLSVMRVEGMVERPYGSKGLGSTYQGQEGVTGSGGVK